MTRKTIHSSAHERAQKNGVSRWKCRFYDYSTNELAILTFGTEKDLHAAIDLVWVGKLQGMPFDVVPDGESMAVPKKGIPFFTRAGIKFTQRPLVSK